MVTFRTFGYRHIRVLCPLGTHLRFYDNGLSRLSPNTYRAMMLWPEQQADWDSALTGVMGEVKPFAWAEIFTGEIGRVSKMFVKVLLEAFGAHNAKGEVMLDVDLTDYENVPFTQHVNDYLALEVKPHVPDAYIDPDYRYKKDFRSGTSDTRSPSIASSTSTFRRSNSKRSMRNSRRWRLTLPNRRVT